MNKEQLEKMFDDEFNVNTTNPIYDHYNFDNHSPHEIKDFIFETIIPEVLKSVIPEYRNTQTKDDEINSMRYWRNDCIEEVKQKAKELYWIEL